MRVLILGAAGMLGNAVFRVLSENRHLDVAGTVRSEDVKRYFTPQIARRLMLVDDLSDPPNLLRLLERTRPRVVINCVAMRNVTKADPLQVFSVFSVLPRRIAHLCRAQNARLIQISSDGVFSGAKGQYTEEDLPDADDIYGVAKVLGEVSEPHAITIRTSMIGHELEKKSALLEWFLSQETQCRCYTRAVFSGLPTVVLAQIIRDVVLPRPELFGIYHVAAKAISKYDLLSIVADVYGKHIDIVADDRVSIDRSLNASRFRTATGYEPPDWSELVRVMHSYQFGLAGK